MIRIYADFNNVDERDRVRLNTVGSLADIARSGADLQAGKTVRLYMTDEFEVDAIVEFDVIWFGIPDWKTIEYYQRPSGP
jgi:hypothetical protein